ncbi:MAG: hypothetical protein EGQ41_02800 [Clostridiales bacterium]|nr:hypothetical protein [Clostridiales bacterium]
MRIIIKIYHMGNFLFREISAVTESQRGAECAIRQKGKKITHSLRYDCPDGRLSSIILHVVHHLSVSHMIGMTYIYQMLWGKSSGNKRSDQKHKGQQFILVDGNVPCGVQ